MLSARLLYFKVPIYLSLLNKKPWLMLSLSTCYQFWSGSNWSLCVFSTIPAILFYLRRFSLVHLPISRTEVYLNYRDFAKNRWGKHAARKGNTDGFEKSKVDLILACETPIMSCSQKQLTTSGLKGLKMVALGILGLEFLQEQHKKTHKL